MRILIATAGSQGDVAPFTGLGARLREAGHEVSLATHARFETAAHAAHSPWTGSSHPRCATCAVNSACPEGVQLCNAAPTPGQGGRSCTASPPASSRNRPTGGRR
ncbi:glycosyltransferase [Kitasatospora sp. GP82]|uniref:glycosyltransferase n=1 Tax=Kitasatospora sp. GP82 TaxID=3035089 RepID=UPI0032AF76A4